MREENLFIKLFKTLGIIIALFAFIIITELIVAFALGFFLGSANMLTEESSITDYAIYQVMFGQLLRGILIYVFIKMRAKKFKDLNEHYICNRGVLLDSGKLIIVGLGAAGLGTIIVTLLLNILRDNPMVIDTVTALESIVVADGLWDWIITFISVVILAPIVEEFIFRGVLFSELNRYWSIIPTILFTSFLFGLYHANILQGVNTFVLSLVLCTVYYYRRNITDSIIVHMVNNLVAFVSGLDAHITSLIMILCFISIFISIYILIGFRKKFDKEKEKDIQKNLLNDYE